MEGVLTVTIESLCTVRYFSPGQMGEVGVYGAANNLTVDATEVLNPVAESHNLGGTHKCEVQWVEEEDDIFS